MEEMSIVKGERMKTDLNYKRDGEGNNPREYHRLVTGTLKSMLLTRGPKVMDDIMYENYRDAASYLEIKGEKINLEPDLNNRRTTDTGFAIEAQQARAAYNDTPRLEEDAQPENPVIRVTHEAQEHQQNSEHGEIRAPDEPIAATNACITALREYIVERSQTNFLGQGGYGKVWIGRKKTDSKLKVAVKLLDLDRCPSKYIDREREFAIKLKSNGHRNVVKFLAVEMQATAIYLVLELCDMNLDTFFQQAQTLVCTDAVFSFTQDMAEGLRHLHGSCNICHRDLKPSNVLVSANCAKIADLGLARNIPPVSSASPCSLSGNIGTPGWRAPEGDGEYGYPVDMFALALIIHAMLTHTRGKKLKPFSKDGESLADWMRAEALREERVEVPDLHIPSSGDGVTKELHTLIREMLAHKPRERINAQELCERLQKLKDAVFLRNFTPESVERIKKMTLGFKAHSRAGLGERGTVILAEKRLIHKIRFDGERYKMILNLKPPAEIQDYCFKAVDSEDNMLLSASANPPTVFYNDGGDEIHRFSRPGALLHAAGGQLFYGEKAPRPKTGWQICVHRENGSTITLNPPAKRPAKPWGRNMSVCRVHDKYAVTAPQTSSSSSSSSSLDIFNEKGERVAHKDLGYMPLSSNAVTRCASGHVLIAEDSRPARLHVHETHGACREVTVLTHTHLGLERGARVLAIGFSHLHGGVLHACVGGSSTNIEALHAYRLKYR